MAASMIDWLIDRSIEETFGIAHLATSCRGGHHKTDHRADSNGHQHDFRVIEAGNRGGHVGHGEGLENIAENNGWKWTQKHIRFFFWIKHNKKIEKRILNIAYENGQ